MDTIDPCAADNVVTGAGSVVLGLSGKTGSRHPAINFKGAIIDPLRAAREDYDGVVELTRRLVWVPSRGGIDPYGPVLECMSAWLGEHGLACRRARGALR